MAAAAAAEWASTELACLAPVLKQVSGLGAPRERGSLQAAKVGGQPARGAKSKRVAYEAHAS